MKDMDETNKPMDPQQPAQAETAGQNTSAMSGAANGGIEEGKDVKPKLSTLNLVIVSLLSMAMLAGGFALAAQYGDLSMRAGDASMNKPMTDTTTPINEGVKAMGIPPTQGGNGGIHHE